MRNPLSSTFALTAAALFLAGCGKDQPSSQSPGGSDAPAATTGDSTLPDDAADEGGDVAEVKCLGINECSGQSGCDVAGSHECGGQNECKGKGWILASQSECEGKGGTVL